MVEARIAQLDWNHFDCKRSFIAAANFFTPPNVERKP